MNKYYNINNLFDEKGDPIKVTIKRIGDMTRDELLDYIIELDEINGRYERKLEKQTELASHYKHLYSKVKKQKDDVVEYIKNNKLFNYVYDEEELFEITTDKQAKDDLLRMLGEKDE